MMLVDDRAEVVEEQVETSQIVLPVAEDFIEKLFVPQEAHAEATWPSACKVAGLWTPDDF